MADTRGQVLNLSNAEDLAAALKNWYPGITFQRTGKGDDRVIRIVCGAPMTIGDSPRDAAEAWLGQFVEVFGVTEPELEFAWERPMRERQDWKVSKTVLRYRQTMQGIPVVGSDVRVMTTRDRGAKGPGALESVSFVEGVLLPRPERGLEPWVSATEAINIARELRPNLTKWSEARLSVVPVAPTHAKFGSLLSWMLEGTGTEPALDELLCIDAHTGELIRSSPLRIGSGGHGHGASAHARTTPARGARHEAPALPRGAHEGAPSGLPFEAASHGGVVLECGPNDITGTVTAWRIPNWYSDTRFIVPTPNPPPSGCYRDPVESRQAEVKMELLDSGGTTVLDTAFTDGSGEYVLTAPSSGSYKVRATLAGRNWTVVHWDGCGSGDPEPVRLGPVDVTAGSTGVDFEFGSSSATAQEVADVIAHEIVRQLVDDWDDPMSEDPIDEPFLVWTDKLGSGAFFDWPRTGWTCDVTLSFGIGSPTGGEYVHWSTPTIIDHEFGHLVAYR